MTCKIREKFTPKWEGPYVVYEVYTNGAYKIVDGEGFQLVPAWPNKWQVLKTLLSF